MKPQLRGFLDRGGVPRYSWMLGYVLEIDWKTLQPTPNSPLDTSSGSGYDQVMSAISAIRTFNAANPNQPARGLKLRTGAAGGAPADLVGMSPGPFTVTDPADGNSTHIGPFWTSAYGDAYADFQRRLWQAFESSPEFRENVIGMCGFVYEEPFRRYSTDILTGWSVSADQTAFYTMIDAHQVWKTTRQDLAYNPYSAPGADQWWCDTFLSAARVVFGKQLVNGNNSIRATTGQDEMYNAIKSAGPPIYFQTATIARLGDPATTFEFAVNNGANSVELPTYTSIPESVLQTYQAKLYGNPVG